LDKFCAVIPAYNEETRIAPVVREAAKYVDAVIVVDDGSTDRTAQAAAESGATVVKHAANLGKGAALSTGLARAVEGGFTAAITLDADGQHDPRDIPRFLDEFRASRADIIIGTRMQNRAGMPFIRAATNVVTSLVISLLAGQRVGDSQSGFRLLACATAARLPVAGARFDAESEIIVKAARSGLHIREIPIATIYHAVHQSKINPVRDTCRFVMLILRLIFDRR
jgi:glycosyltransferase involved in cell wall biosynthesis